MVGKGKPGSRGVVDSTMPALYSYCEIVYEAMRKNANPTFLEEEDSESLVYEGFITKLVLEKPDQGGLGIHVPNYSKVMAALKEMGCIEQLRRGGGNTPSQFLILDHPTRQLWYEKVPEGPKTHASHKYDVMEQRLRDLTAKVLELETARDNV